MVHSSLLSRSASTDPDFDSEISLASRDMIHSPSTSSSPTSRHRRPEPWPLLSAEPIKDHSWAKSISMNASQCRGSPATSFLNPYADFSYLPAHATDDLRAATISIRNPEAIESVYKAERCREFTALVRRYMNQLLYGCTKSHCTTPTCYTCRKALAKGGLGNGRKLTVLSARIIASHLASRDDPYAGLCNGKPAVHGIADEDEGQAEGLKRHRQGVDHGLKDSKSFTQQLFDTKPLKMIQWLGFPPPFFKFAPEGWKEDTARHHEAMEEVESPVRQRGRQITPETKRDRSSLLRSSRSSPDATAVSNADDFFDSKTAADSGIMPPTSITTVPPPSSPARKRQNSLKDKIVTPTPHSNLRSKSPPLGPPPLPHHNRHHKPPPLFDPLHYYDYSQIPQWKTVPQLTPSRPPRQKIGLQKSEIVETPSPMATFSTLETPVPNGKSSLRPAPAHSPANGSMETYISPPQMLSHLNAALIRSLALMRIEPNVPRNERSKAEKFAKQSVFYVLSTPEALDKSFRFLGQNIACHNVLDINYFELDPAMRELLKWWDAAPSPREYVVLNALWKALGEIYKVKKVIPRSSLSKFSSPKFKGSGMHAEESGNVAPGENNNSNPGTTTPVLDNVQTARIILISLHALAAMLPKTIPNTEWKGIGDALWSILRDSRSKGWVTSPWEDVFDNQLAERLMSRIVRGLEFRIELDRRSGRGTQLIDLLKPYFAKCFQSDFSLLIDSTNLFDPDEQFRHKLNMGYNWTFAGVVLDWAKSLLLKAWDGEGQVQKGTVASGTLGLMKILYEIRKECFIPDQFFEVQLVADRLDPKLTPPDWFKEDPAPETTTHLFHYQFLFSPSTLVSYFRSINMFRMTKAYEGALNAISLIRQVSLNDHGENLLFIREHFVYDRLRIATSQYMLFCVRRETLVRDAFNYIYKRELRELRKPLKVKFMDQGEEGLDQGGPQQEFFNILMKEVFNPDYGMFVQDSTSHVNWFAICPMEPIHKYELLGALVGVAVYNGITLPLNFPKVMYMKLLGYPMDALTLDDIEDGWGPLVKGLRELLNWEDGDVEDIFMRTYEFSYELPWGEVKSIDMFKARKQGRTMLEETAIKDSRKSPKDKDKQGFCEPEDIDDDKEAEKENIDPEASSSSQPQYTAPCIRPSQVDVDEETPFVTNDNRYEYVRDYLLWLTTYSVHHQFTAFSRGFFSVIEPKSLTLFNPTTLHSLLEGTTEIDMDALQASAKYDEGYHTSHPAIRTFWSVVKEYTPEMKRQLLEFVTASDRVPSNGIESVPFVVQRSGGDSDRVPTSMTCFGRLLLPEYESRTKMKEKLALALEHSRGFGVP